jgi:lipopolysaccharide cholinephosphotransferase
VGDFTGYNQFVCTKDVFSKFVEVEFEGHYYKAPGGYDFWLREIYGNYMELPPIDKRVSTHIFDAYTLD